VKGTCSSAARSFVKSSPRGVGLDEVLVARVVVAELFAEHAVLRAHDAHRHRLPEAEGVADREHVVADAHVIRVAQRDGLEVARSLVEAHDRDVRGGVAAEDARAQLAVVRELDDDLVGAGHDVVVREDDAALVDDEARAERLLLLAPRLRRREPELLSEHLAPRILDGDAPDELRALDRHDRALDAVDERRDRARLGGNGARRRRRVRARHRREHGQRGQERERPAPSLYRPQSRGSGHTG
jgi:hypothetical protein